MGSLMIADQPPGIIVISNDRGGLVGDYIRRIYAAKQLKIHIKVDGDCLSACTMILGLRDQVCITHRANFGFHHAKPQAFDAVLMQHYPPIIRTWLTDVGLTDDFRYLGYQELKHLYPTCEE